LYGSLNSGMKAKLNVLLVENDKLLGECIYCGLHHYNYDVDWVESDFAAKALLQTKYFDTIILSFDLPKQAGEGLLESLRSKDILSSVIIISEFKRGCDRAKWLDSGADDYICKPFELEELCARIRAVHRRVMSRLESNIVVGNITLNMATRQVFKSSQAIKTSYIEFVLLQMLIKKTGYVLSRRYILDHLYEWSDNINSNVLEVHIHNLRKKLGADIIATVRKEGYVFVKQLVFQ
jgi:two-component system, OmpR family, response regulator QseB